MSNSIRKIKKQKDWTEDKKGRINLTVNPKLDLKITSRFNSSHRYGYLHLMKKIWEGDLWTKIGRWIFLSQIFSKILFIKYKLWISIDNDERIIVKFSSFK